MANAANEHEQDDGDVADRQVSQKSPRTPGPAFAAPESHLEDLSQELSQTLPRRSGELVRCRRIWGDRYRCNWWGPQDKTGHDHPTVEGLVVTTHRVIRSQMIRATRVTDGLTVNADARQ